MQHVENRDRIHPLAAHLQADMAHALLLPVHPQALELPLERRLAGRDVQQAPGQRGLADAAVTIEQHHVGQRVAVPLVQHVTQQVAKLSLLAHAAQEEPVVHVDGGCGGCGHGICSAWSAVETAG